MPLFYNKTYGAISVEHLISCDYILLYWYYITYIVGNDYAPVICLYVRIYVLYWVYNKYYPLLKIINISFRLINLYVLNVKNKAKSSRWNSWRLRCCERCSHGRVMLSHVRCRNGQRRYGILFLRQEFWFGIVKKKKKNSFSKWKWENATFFDRRALLCFRWNGRRLTNFPVRCLYYINLKYIIIIIIIIMLGHCFSIYLFVEVHRSFLRFAENAMLVMFTCSDVRVYTEQRLCII